MRAMILLMVLTVLPLRADDIQDKIDAAAKTLTDADAKIGFVVGVRVNGKNTISGYGSVTVPGGPIVPRGDTLFEIGSITKTFTGVLLAEGVRRGELALDAPAAKALPADVPLPAAITLGHLATHRSGLPEEPPLIGAFAKNPANPYADYDRFKLNLLLDKLKPDEPGQKHVYSNLGAGIAGIAAVHAAKASSFDALVRERISLPLKMKDTTEALNGEQRSRLARGHTAKGDPTGPWDFACLEACGGLRSSVDDMLRYAAANLGETDQAVVKAMTASHRPRIETENARSSIGLFWITTAGKRNSVLWHNGGTGGYHSILAMLPEKKIAVVVLSASAKDNIDRMAMVLLNAMADAK